MVRVGLAEMNHPELEFVCLEPTQTTPVSEESSPSVSFTLVQGGSSLLNQLEPLLFTRNFHLLRVLLEFRVVRLCQTHLNHCSPLEIVCRTVLLEFKVVHLCQTHSNHCSPLAMMSAGQFYRIVVRQRRTTLNSNKTLRG